jgi:hypothetical protein
MNQYIEAEVGTFEDGYHRQVESRRLPPNHYKVLSYGTFPIPVLKIGRSTKSLPEESS